jgi:protein SCO1/2
MAISARSFLLAIAATLSLAIVSGRALAFPQTPSGPPAANLPPPVDYVPVPLRGIEIADKRGTSIPRALRFLDQDGREVELGSAFDGRPVVVVFAYYDCPMLCTVVLNGLKNGLKDLAWTPGKEFRVVTVSFDPRDTPAKAKAKQAAYHQAYGRPIEARGWEFLAGLTSHPSPTEAHPEALELAKALGFAYRWDPSTEQFAHPAGAFVFAPDGKLTQVLHGISFSERDLRLALTEASQGKLGTTWDRVLLLCYHYDPNEQGYVLAGKRMMRAGGGMTALALGVFLGRLWRREMRKKPLDLNGEAEG